MTNPPDDWVKVGTSTYLNMAKYSRVLIENRGQENMSIVLECPGSARYRAKGDEAKDLLAWLVSIYG